MFKIQYLTILPIILCLGACSSRPPVTSGLGSELIQQGDNYAKRLVVDNPSLGKQLEITDIKTRQTNDLLEVNLQLSSHYNKSLKLQYHFNWFDAQGFIVEAQKTPWKALELHGMQTVLLRGVAPNAGVESFNLYVREVTAKAYNY
jgi:uncharacterized protein YcfL